MTPLAKDGTATLFNKIQFVNAQENWGIEETSADVVVTAYAIQTENLTSSNVTAPLDVWAVLSANAIHQP